MSDTAQSIAAIIVLGIIIVAIAIINTIEKEKKLAEFRYKLKVGDETDQGVVIAINGYHVTTEKTNRIENIKPYEKEKN
jgi:hypothetical protein